MSATRYFLEQAATVRAGETLWQRGLHLLGVTCHLTAWLSNTQHVNSSTGGAVSLIFPELTSMWSTNSPPSECDYEQKLKAL